MNTIIDYYENYDENSRLNRDNTHRTEFITTTYILDNLINKKSKIIDIGAGTGNYSFYYAKKRHKITLGQHAVAL